MDHWKTTPPGIPKYGVNVANETILKILQIVWPNFSPDKTESVAIAPLPASDSYNNRIYLIDIASPVESCPPSLALKVNGSGFGPSKIDNEAACLHLLKRYCPETPTPSPLAWSPDGKTISKSQGTGIVTLELNLGAESVPGWLLMNRLEGSQLKFKKLSDTEKIDIADQLAKVLCQWRTSIPKSRLAGNIRFGGEYANDKTAFRTNDNTTNTLYYIYGHIDIGIEDHAEAMDSLLEYWKTKLSYIAADSTNPKFKNDRASLMPRFRSFLDVTLPKLPLLSDSTKATPYTQFTFTHTDLAPHNLLVSCSPPKLTGIVDFEYSGYFPVVEEFLYKVVTRDDWGWSQTVYQRLMQNMEDAGEVTPLSLQKSESQVWDQLRLLMTLEIYLCPWWISDGHLEGEELRKELDDSRGKVEDALSQLESIAENAS